MINILFVCLGNICRSPLAEGVFRELVKQRGLDSEFACDSAGTSSYHIGDLPDRRTRENAEERGLMLTHRARRMTGEDLAKFDYFVAIDEANFETIQQLSLRSLGFYSEENTSMLREFDNLESDNPNVPDPYYEDAAVFEQVYQITYRCCTQLLIYLAQRHNLPLTEQVPSTPTV